MRRPGIATLASIGLHAAVVEAEAVGAVSVIRLMLEKPLADKRAMTRATAS